MKLLLIIPLLLVGCISAPDRLDYETETCFDAAYCRYLSAKSKFNLGCSKDADACNKIRTLKDCDLAALKIKDLTFQGCWDKLR